MVVLPVHTAVERGVHKEVGQGVGHRRRHIAESAVDGPRVEALGNLLVARRVVVVLVEVLVAPRDIAVLVYLVIVVELGESRGEKVKR